MEVIDFVFFRKQISTEKKLTKSENERLVKSEFKPSGFRENNENSFFERNIEKKNYLTLHFNI